ncbi:hypothetical protein ACQKPX_05580 [Photobacterium sp. DNB23_23_1]|uniref:Uncharacterized protein n=1 Tax=Photobacterium pectinilyticum TaxID=2906793 RepID=A0ABT1MXN0_9GAMM|nr:hypothetical protein [Photobacterium sp. ZSDE20]MCQ1057246.1 hypothetical protein [Photobacterium sp. ZSDE20]MDD1821704.1 hypothetical protein [Photobacterium sp. ZSDE20]
MNSVITTGLLGMALGCSLLVVSLEQDGPQAGEGSRSQSYAAQSQSQSPSVQIQQDYIAELYRAREKLKMLGEENSALFLSIENAIAINEELFDDAGYWRAHYLSPSS